MNRDIIKEINSENERRLTRPFFWAFALPVITMLVTWIAIESADWFLAVATTVALDYPVQGGIILVLGSLIILIRREL